MTSVFEQDATLTLSGHLLTNTQCMPDVDILSLQGVEMALHFKHAQNIVSDALVA